MFRMKGITPIISIIVLLLIMVALAGAAWTYISGFMGAYTTKVVDIPPGSSYFDGRNVKIMLRNIGTSAINTGSCTVNNNNTATCGDITITREGSTYDVDIRPSAAIISPKGSITITDYNCQAGNVKYVISSPSSTYQVNVNANTMCSFDPISWWKFDGDAKDSVGSNHGTPYGGVLWANDAARGQVAGFDGVDDYVGAGNAVSLNITNAITIEAWVRHSAGVGSGHEMMVGKGDTYSIYWDKPDLKIRSGLKINGVWGDTGGTAVLPENTWVHVAITYDGSYVDYYSNGVRDEHNSYPGSITPSSNPLQFGGSTYWADHWFGGLIDDVMIFNRALSPEEIKAIYNSQKK